MLEIVEASWLGNLDTMLMNRITEMPFPIPNSVICSPSHISRQEPAQKEATITIAGQIPVASAVSVPFVFIRT